jgi:hypothetical protein
LRVEGKQSAEFVFAGVRIRAMTRGLLREPYEVGFELAARKDFGRATRTVWPRVCGADGCFEPWEERYELGGRSLSTTVVVARRFD